MKARALLLLLLGVLGCGDDRPQRTDTSASASDTAEEPSTSAIASAEPGPAPIDTQAAAALEAAFAPGSVCVDPAGLYTSTAPLPTASGSASTGPALSPKCEDYFTKMRRCMEESVKLAPQSTKESVMKSVLEAERQSRVAWHKLDHGTLDAICKTALEALDSNPACPP